MTTPTESVQCFGRTKTAVAVTHCKRSHGLIKINGCPIELVEPEILRFKAYEPVLLPGRQRFAGVDMRIRVKGGELLVRYDRTLLVADPRRCGPSAPVDYGSYDTLTERHKGGKSMGFGTGLAVGAVVGAVGGLALEEGLKYEEEKITETLRNMITLSCS